VILVKKYYTLLKNVGIFTIGSLGTKLVTFLLLPLYTSILSTADYGLVDVLQSTAQLLMPILLLSIQDATLRFCMDDNYKKDDVLSTTINILVKGTLVLAVGIIMLNTFKIFNIGVAYWLFLFLSFVLNALNNCFVLYLKSVDKAFIIAISGILGTIVTCVSNILCLTIFKMGIDGYMLSGILGIFVQMMYLFVSGKLYLNLHIKNYKNLSKPMIKYSAPLIINSVSWWINNASDRYVVTSLLGVAANGIYAVSYKIPVILTTIQSVFYNAWSVSAISEFDKDDRDGFIGNNYTAYALLSIVACSILILLNIHIASFLYSESFFEAWKCVPFLLVSTFFYGIAQFEGALYAAAKKTKLISITSFISATINIIFNIILIKIFGLMGAALSTMFSFFMMYFLRTIFMKKFITIKVQWKKHYLSIILLIIQSVLSTFNYLYIVQVILLIIIILIYAKYIKNIMNKFYYKFILKNK